MAKKKVFHSFDYATDAFRVQQIKQMGVVEGQQILDSNDWEKVKRGGDAAIKAWVQKHMSDKECVVVLIGSKTAGREWVNYEIKKGWKDGKGIVGVYIHNLKDSSSKTAAKGKNPFDEFDFGDKKFSSIVKDYDPPSSDPYGHIKSNIEKWVNEAISIRKQHD